MGRFVLKVPIVGLALVKINELAVLFILDPVESHPTSDVRKNLMSLRNGVEAEVQLYGHDFVGDGLSDGGPIAVPPDNSVTIAPDGTVSVVPLFGTPNSANDVGRIKLVNPPKESLARGDDGLFRLRSGQPAEADENLRLAPETLEGSNVNPVDAMVSLISLSRQFEMQIKLLQSADSNASKASQVLSMN